MRPLTLLLGGSSRYGCGPNGIDQGYRVASATSLPDSSLVTIPTALRVSQTSWMPIAVSVLRSYYVRSDTLHENHENYKVEDTFHALFVVIDTIFPGNAFRVRDRNDQDFPGRTSVQLVRTGDLRTGRVDFSSIESVSKEVDGNMDVRRIALGDAVELILGSHRQNTGND